MFHKDTPILRYCQKTLNSCCFSSLEPAFDSIKYFKAENAISIRIKEALESEVGNRIHFANEIMLNNKGNKGEVRVHYQLVKYKRRVNIKFCSTPTDGPQIMSNDALLRTSSIS